jgi:hypothetical protein
MFALFLEIGEMSLSNYFHNLMREKKAIDESSLLWIVKQMLTGLNEVHSAG